MASRALRLLLVGAPGSGKGTQTRWLRDRYPWMGSVSSGDILRSRGNEFADILRKGQLLPDVLVTGVMLQELKHQGYLKTDASWLLDGFPRTVEQAKMLDGHLMRSDSCLTHVLELDVPQEVILERVEQRYVHLPSGRVYNLSYNPPKTPGKDDITGERLVRRQDDDSSVWTKRLASYNELVAPLREHYTSKGIFTKVSGKTSDEIFPKLQSLIERWRAI